jgi:hypothetical protein
MKSSDLADYLDHDPFPESSEPWTEHSPPVKSTASLTPPPPETPAHPQALEDMQREQHRRETLRLVMDVFPGATWVTKDEYRRRAAQRDRKSRRRRG